LTAGAGRAARLPGTVAGWSTRPVIGVPLSASPLNGLESLLSIVQMPPGVPVATVAIGEAGARNAAYLAAQIIGLGRPEVAELYQAVRDRFVEETEGRWGTGRRCCGTRPSWTALTHGPSCAPRAPDGA